MNGYRALVGALDTKLIQASLRAMPGEEPTLDGKTQAQIWQTAPAPAPSVRSERILLTNEQETAGGVTRFFLPTGIGLLIGAAGGALLWASHRLLGGLLGAVLGGGAGAGLGLLLTMNYTADAQAARQAASRAGVKS